MFNLREVIVEARSIGQVGYEVFFGTSLDFILKLKIV